MTSHTDCRILLADDDPVMQLLITEYLTLHGCRVRCVGDGDACLDEITADPPTLLLLDLHMPKRNGLEVLIEARRRYVEIPFPVVVLSADCTERHAVEASSMATATLAKPFELHRLLDLVDSLLSPSTAPS